MEFFRLSPCLLSIPIPLFFLEGATALLLICRLGHVVQFISVHFKSAQGINNHRPLVCNDNLQRGSGGGGRAAAAGEEATSTK